VNSPFRVFLLARAVPALVAAAVITFSANHSVIVGQLVFMIYAFVIAPVFIWAAFACGFVSRVRVLYVISGAAAVLAAAITAITIGGGLIAFTLTVGIWAALSGALELWAGWTTSTKAQSREMLLLGGLTAVLGLVEAVVPLNDVYAVGLFGAYAAIVAVFAAIAGFSTSNSAVAAQQKEG
jgi:uncharacterized membrane protein HdeD (DUF308 family)